MDAVELPHPVDVAVAQLMGSEGFGRAGVTVKDVEARESDCVSILASRCSSLTSRKGDVIMSDVTSCVQASESAMLDKLPDTKLCRSSFKLPSFQDEHVSEQVHCRGSNCLPSTTRLDGAQLHISSTKMSKTSTVCLMRQGTTQIESTSLAGVDDVKDILDRPESRQSKCTSSEKNQLVKQKNNIHGKRSEKRCPRVPTKGKYDSFPLKAGSASSGAASGGSNFLGLYGLKSDAPDVTKLIDDFSLIGLLDGTYEAPNVGKGKGKKEPNMNETLLHTVRKTGSVLDPLRPVQAQKVAEISNSKPGTSSDVLDLPLYQPKDVLERLALPPPKDLESLLLDASKPTISSRNTPDPRPGKQVTRRPSLPPFPWSYTFSGQSRTSSDTIKLSSSRNACQGRWARIENIASALGVANDGLSNLDSLKYEHNLVPLEYKIEPWFEWGSSSSAPRSKEGVKHEGNGMIVQESATADDCPRILAAAQTLMNIAALQNKDVLTWQKKASQKTSRARKSRLSEKDFEVLEPPIPFLGSDYPSKKAKLFMTEGKKDHVANTVKKGSVNWSTPKSVRSSPNKSERDSINIMKTSFMMPPPSRVLGKSIDSEHRIRNGERKDSVSGTRCSSSYTFKPCNSEQKVNGQGRPRSSAITDWHHEGKSSRSIEKTRDSDKKLKKLKVDWNDRAREPATRVPEKADEFEQRPRKLPVEKTMLWRNMMHWK